MSDKMKIEKVQRKVRPAEAVLVTEDNMSELAGWCNGLVVPIGGLGGDNTKPYIHVPVRSPRRDSDSQAFVGDYVVKEHYNFRIVPAAQFKKGYDNLANKQKAAGEAMREMAAVKKTDRKNALASAGVPEPTQVGAVAVTPGTPPEAGTHGRTTGAVAVDPTDTDPAAQTVPLEPAPTESDVAEATDKVLDTSGTTEVVDKLCGECGSAVIAGACSNNVDHNVDFNGS